MALYEALVSIFIYKNHVKWAVHTQLNPPGSVLTEGGVVMCTPG